MTYATYRTYKKSRTSALSLQKEEGRLAKYTPEMTMAPP